MKPAVWLYDVLYVFQEIPCQPTFPSPSHCPFRQWNSQTASLWLYYIYIWDIISQLYSINFRWAFIVDLVLTSFLSVFFFFKCSLRFFLHTCRVLLEDTWYPLTHTAFTKVSGVTLWMAILINWVGPPLLARLRNLNSYWIECHEMLYRHFVIPRGWILIFHDIYVPLRINCNSLHIIWLFI